MPEGLPLLAGTGQVGVARRLADRQALLRRLSAVEALGRVDVACTDKTGTLTEGRLAVRLVADGEHEAHCLATLADDGLRQVSAHGGPGQPPPRRRATRPPHPTDVAVVRAAAGRGPGRGTARRRREARRPSTRAGLPRHGRRGPRVRQGGAGRDLSSAAPACAAATATSPWTTRAGRRCWIGPASLAERGLRVLHGRGGSARRAAGRPRDLTALGFVGISDPLRPTVPAAVRRCREAGVRVIMITGDHPATARAIAREAGLLDEDGEVLTGGELAELPDDELDRRLERAPVIARATPLDKLRIIEGLRRRGHVVAMTGDGVNDAPALRLADVGVAMGRGGTEVARQAADVVLADDDFATLVEALVEGRGFWRNMRRALGLLLGGNVGELGLIVGASVLGFASPLNTRQILVVNLITDALPGLSVVLQRPEHRNLAGLAREGTSALDASLRRDVLRRGAATALPALAAYFSPGDGQPGGGRLGGLRGDRDEAAGSDVGRRLVGREPQPLGVGGRGWFGRHAPGHAQRPAAPRHARVNRTDAPGLGLDRDGVARRRGDQPRLLFGQLSPCLLTRPGPRPEGEDGPPTAFMNPACGDAA